MFLVLIVALVVVFAALSLLSSKKRPKSSPPTAHLGLPIIGNYMEFAKQPVDFIKRCFDKYGSIYTVPMLHKNLTFLIGPEVSAPFFALSDEKMSQSEVYGFMTPVFGKGVVYDAPTKRRQQQMQTMANGLKSLRLASYVPKIEREVELYFKERWGKSGTCNLLDALSELTILTSSRCLHGDDVRENLFADVARIYHDLDKGVTPLSFFFPYAPTPAHSQRDAARKEMIKIFSKIIKARRESGVIANESTQSDILQLYIDFHYKDDGSALNDEEIVGLLIALLFAGQHTSSISSTWTAMFLIHHPELLNRVMGEQSEVLTPDAGEKPISNVELNFDQIGKMELLTNCIKEALRMYPPLIMLMRMALEDVETTTADGRTFVIPKGDIVITSPAVASRLDTVFTNPDKYDPDRFNEERAEHKGQYAYLGFGAGRHACLGQQFGILQVKTILSILFRNYKIEPVVKDFPEPDYTAMVVGPKNHCEVKFTKLDTCRW